MSKPNILLFGANGRIGKTVGRTLTNKGFEVYNFVRNEHVSSQSQVQADNVRLGNILDRDSLVRALSGISTVLYFSSFTVPFTSSNDPTLEFSLSLPAINNLLMSISLSASRPRLVFPSSGGSVYGQCRSAALETSPLRPTSGYALGKVLAEQTIEFFARTAGLTFDILRLTNVYGGGTRHGSPQGVIDVFIDDTLHDRTSRIWANLETARDYLFVDDFAEALSLYLMISDREKNLTLNVGSSHVHSLSDILEHIHRVSSGKHKYEINHNNHSQVERSEVDVFSFRRITGWTANTAIKDGILKTWERRVNDYKSTIE